MNKHVERHDDGEVIVRLGPVRFWKHPAHIVYSPPINGWTSWELHVGRFELRWNRQ